MVSMCELWHFIWMVNCGQLSSSFEWHYFLLIFFLYLFEHLKQGFVQGFGNLKH